MGNEKGKVITEQSHNGYLIFRLLRRNSEIRSEAVFGYSARHKLWVRIFGFGETNMTFIPEAPEEAKESIAAWFRYNCCLASSEKGGSVFSFEQ